MSRVSLCQGCSWAEAVPLFQGTPMWSVVSPCRGCPWVPPCRHTPVINAASAAAPQAFLAVPCRTMSCQSCRATPRRDSSIPTQPPPDASSSVWRWGGGAAGRWGRSAAALKLRAAICAMQIPRCPRRTERFRSRDGGGGSAVAAPPSGTRGGSGPGGQRGRPRGETPNARKEASAARMGPGRNGAAADPRRAGAPPALIVTGQNRGCPLPLSPSFRSAL